MGPCVFPFLYQSLPEKYHDITEKHSSSITASYPCCEDPVEAKIFLNWSKKPRTVYSIDGVNLHWKKFILVLFLDTHTILFHFRLWLSSTIQPVLFEFPCCNRLDVDPTFLQSSFRFLHHFGIPSVPNPIYCSHIIWVRSKPSIKIVDSDGRASGTVSRAFEKINRINLNNYYFSNNDQFLIIFLKNN